MDLHSAAETPLIESEQIDSLLDAAGVDGVKDILEAFWRSTDQLSADLARCIETGACADAARTAHALKGSAANVGANRLADAARRVEALSKNGDLAGVTSAVDRLAAIYRETRAALDRLLSERA
ncbi:MAG: Hpt domain-containing protein [Parvularculaceae bacterium]